MSKLKTAVIELFRGNFDPLFNALSWRLPGSLFYFYRAYLLYSESPKLIARPNSSYFKRFVTEADLPVLKKAGISEELVKRRLAEGDRCVIMGRDDEIMSIIWGSSGKRFLKLGGWEFDPHADGVMLYAGFTNEEARFKGLFPTSFKYLYEKYTEEGRPKVYAGIHSTNLNSLKLHHRMNFETIGETVYFILLGVSFCYYKKWPWPTAKLRIFFRRPPRGLYWI